MTITCKVEGCAKGWVEYVHVFDLIYDVQHVDGEKKVVATRKELVEERHVMKFLNNTDLGMAALEAHTDRQVIEFVAKPCPTHLPGWIHPEKRKRLDDEELAVEQERAARKRAVKQEIDDEDAVKVATRRVRAPLPYADRDEQ